MPQGIQEKEEPTQGKVDKGLQEVSWLEEIKNIRQAHHIFQRMKMAKKIQKAKDIKEVLTMRPKCLTFVLMLTLRWRETLL